MPSRRFHGKTRTGCSSCKARHVKCGEETPVCSNCIRRNTECIYLGNSTTVSPTTSTPPHVRKQSASRVSDVSVGCNDAAAATGPFDSLDLTLMHRYSTRTSTTLLSSSTAQHLWQFGVPELAQGNSIVQHGMLALASMEWACSAARECDMAQLARCRARSLHHQQTALPLFRDLLERSSTLEDQHVIFIFSIMLLMLAFASASTAEASPTLDDILDLFALFRGPKILWEKHEGEANKQLINMMFPKPLVDIEDVFALHEVAGQVSALESLPLDEACADAVSKLKDCWKFVQAEAQGQEGQDIRAMGWFPALISDEFFQQVKTRQANALAILSQYGVIVRQFQERWWIGAWADILDSAIRSACHETGSQLPDLRPDGKEDLAAQIGHVTLDAEHRSVLTAEETRAIWAHDESQKSAGQPSAVLSP